MVIQAKGPSTINKAFKMSFKQETNILWLLYPVTELVSRIYVTVLMSCSTNQSSDQRRRSFIPLSSGSGKVVSSAMLWPTVDISNFTLTESKLVYTSSMTCLRSHRRVFRVCFAHVILHSPMVEDVTSQIDHSLGKYRSHLLTGDDVNQ